MTDPKVLLDQRTGLQNTLVSVPEELELTFISAKTQESLNHDQQELDLFEKFKTETFNHFASQASPLNNIEFIKQLVADAEWCFPDRKCGYQKKAIVHKAFLQYYSKMENSNYNMYEKMNIDQIIDDQFKQHKSNLKKITMLLHKGLTLISRSICMH